MFATQTVTTDHRSDTKQPSAIKNATQSSVAKLIFGVDSKVKSNTILQNNLTEFEWVVKNKIFPVFWARNIVGENSLDEEELTFLHSQGCQVALIYCTPNPKVFEEQGCSEAENAVECVKKLKIPDKTAIFLEISEDEEISREYLRGYAQVIYNSGYTPGFKANTDAKYNFDCEFSKGMQNDKEIFNTCLVWAVAPNLKEYDRITTSHFIRPDNWKPYAPSGIKRRNVAIWQYGKNCHPIDDDNEVETTFNVDLIRNHDILLDKMF